jgi:hypothetical protein
MADDKPSAAEAKLAEVLPPFEAGPPPDPPEKVVPSKGDDAYDTPSGYALAKVGAPDPDADPTSAKERERGLKYLYEKVKKRHGIG